MRSPVLLLLVALLGVAPTTAVAHAGVDDQTGFFKAEADGLAVTLQSDHLVQKAQREIVFNVTVYSNASGRFERVENMGVHVEAAGPVPANVSTAATADGYQARVVFPAPGEWLLMARVNGTIRSFAMHVYPPSSVRLEAGDFRTNFHYAGMPVRERAYVVDEKTNLLVNATGPGTARVDPENGTGNPIFVRLEPNSLGGFTFEHTFPEPARYVVRIESPGHGIGYDDLPPLPLVIGPPFAGAAPQESPGVGGVAMLAVVALLAVGLTRRR